jgi:hypothetical protein
VEDDCADHDPNIVDVSADELAEDDSADIIFQITLYIFIL